MDYAASDSSGTDDDLPPSHLNRSARGRMTENGRGVAPSYPRVQNDMEIQIHQLEKEAYSSVLRAFKAQSDAITWEKESLITELRKELRLSDEEHRELLSRVNADDVIHRIREWRQEGGLQPVLLNNSQPFHDPVPSPTVSASRKRQKTSLPLGVPLPAPHSRGVVTLVQPSSSAGKRGVAPGTTGKEPQSGRLLSRGSSMKSLQYPSMTPSGRGQITNMTFNDGTEPAEAAAYDPLIGRKVMTRWPADGNFYEAVITEYNPHKGLHTLVYDINTKNALSESVNLKEISPEDILWEGEDPGLLPQVDRGESCHGINKSINQGAVVPGDGRERGPLKTQSTQDFTLSRNDTGKQGSEDIEILHTESLLKEAEHVFSSGLPDPLEMEKMKKKLKEHEQSLVDAISMLADLSDGGHDGGEDPFMLGQQMNLERGWESRQYAEAASGLIPRC